MKDVYKNITEFPLGIIGIMMVPFLNNDEILITDLIIIGAAATLVIRYQKGEFALYATGFPLGTFFEWFGDQVNQLQYWEQTSLFGLPLWLPFFWGFIAIYIRRLGNLIVTS